LLLRYLGRQPGSGRGPGLIVDDLLRVTEVDTTMTEDGLAERVAGALGLLNPEVDSCRVCRRDAQRFQNAGSGLRQRAQSGLRSVPPSSGAQVPQPKQVIQRLRHNSQTGVPVATWAAPAKLEALSCRHD
jgi:hypothetical protein